MYGPAASWRRSFVRPPAGPAADERFGEIVMRDRSLDWRLGVRGDGAGAWLAETGVRVPERSNTAVRDPALGVVARLSDREFLILGRENQTAAAHLMEALPDSGRGPCLPLSRAETHAWVEIAGARTAEVFAKICAVDLRPHRFADLSVAQTVAAEVAAIIVRDDEPGRLRCHVLVESAFAEYLWDCLRNAAQEFR